MDRMVTPCSRQRAATSASRVRSSALMLTRTSAIACLATSAARSSNVPRTGTPSRRSRRLAEVVVDEAHRRERVGAVLEQRPHQQRRRRRRRRRSGSASASAPPSQVLVGRGDGHARADQQEQQHHGVDREDQPGEPLEAIRADRG